MKKIALILCLVLVASFVLSGCNNSDSIITLEDREVGKSVGRARGYLRHFAKISRIAAEG